MTSLKPQDEVRRDAREALRTSPLSSIKLTLVFLAGAVAVSVPIGGVLIALETFNGPAAIGLGTAVVVATLVAFAVVEYERIANRSDLLRELLDSQTSYEALLADARKERDDLRRDKTQLEMVLTSFQVHQILQSQGRVPPGTASGGLADSVVTDEEDTE